MASNQENLEMSPEFIERFSKLMVCIYEILDADWDLTKNCINDELFISNNGTFLDPYPNEFYSGGKGDNWAKRSSFLSAWREMNAFCRSEGIFSLDDHLE